MTEQFPSFGHFDPHPAKTNPNANSRPIKPTTSNLLFFIEKPPSRSFPPSFFNIHTNEAALDNVSYPYQALYYRGGDCTYLSILYCSLLEAVNIETAFITIPGHLYLAFEVGDSSWQSGSADIIELDGNDGIRRRWLPVEITVPASADHQPEMPDRAEIVRAMNTELGKQ